MGLLDLFRSADKQIEMENKQLKKPGHIVAEVVGYQEYDREESYENDEGQTEWRTIREGIVTFRYCVNGAWREESMGPAEGYCGYRVGEQMIVRIGRYGIERIGRALRGDSPNRIV